MAISVKPLSTQELIKNIKSFSSFSGLFRYATKAQVDSLLFKLHSVLTVLILLTGTVFLTMKQYFGDPIECMTGKSDAPVAMVQRYCWMEGSFSAFSRSYTRKSDIHSPYPGLKTPEEGDKIVYHKYYQWVYFVLIVQSVMFYIPRYIWKAVDGVERLKDTINELRDTHIASLQDYDKYRLLTDVADAMYLGSTYFSYYIFCEVLCFLHLVAQIWFTNVFLGGAFWSLGHDWYFYTHSDLSRQYDPLIMIFPRFAKCTFHKFGHSGTVEVIDSLCFLLMNIVNEKIYVILWFWFVFLLFFTLIVLAYRLLLVFPYMRYLLLSQLAPSSSRPAMRRLCCKIGNWFVLHFIAKNIKPSYFADLFEELMEVHFDKRGKKLMSSRFKEEIEKKDKSASKKSKSKSKNKSSSGKGHIGWKTDDPSWNANESTANNTEDWDSQPTAPADDWGDKNEDWTESNAANSGNNDWDDTAQPLNTVDWPDQNVS